MLTLLAPLKSCFQLFCLVLSLLTFWKLYSRALASQSHLADIDGWLKDKFRRCKVILVLCFPPPINCYGKAAKAEVSRENQLSVLFEQILYALVCLRLKRVE